MKLLFIFIIFSSNIIAQNQSDFKNNLEILDSSISYEDKNGYNSILVIGNISNNSDKIYENIVVEIKFFNLEKILIDTFTNELYGNIAPANDTVAFRLQGAAAKSQTQYSSHTIRILEAEVKIPCKSKTGFRKFISNWGGFIFVVFFVFYMVFAVVNYQKSLKEEKQYKQEFMNIANHQTKQSETIIKLLESITKNKH